VDSGWVRITLNADHKFFYIKVADSGVGIPEDAKDKVFERFYRVGKDRSRDTGGTGLGLAIARAAINAHGGTIKLYSESGKGTTFTVRLPIHQEDITSADELIDEVMSEEKDVSMTDRKDNETGE
jgi:signal transduction histidine kinase